MRKLTWASLGLIVLIGYGCARGEGPLSPPAPSHTGESTAPELGTQVISGPSVTSPLGVFTFQVDAGAGTVETTLSRRAEASASLYELSIEDFITAEHLQVESVDVSPTTVDMHLRITHPIPAPTDLDGAPSASNRADLGAALRLLLLHDVTDVESNTYFANDTPIVANTAVVANADGFFTPAGLLQLPSSMNANTFPYLLVVDEGANDGIGNRVGITGVPGNFGKGNYDPENGGWQRHNIGSSNNGWTGYGILHQGQAALVDLRLNRADLAAGESFTFDAVLIAKYLDPRGGNNGAERRSHRLPTSDGDASAFSYRMPYGALDLESVHFQGESGGWRPNEASNTTIRFSVRDWDALATETISPSLLDEPNISMIQIGGSGFPAIWFDVPGKTSAPVEITGSDILEDDSAYGGDPTADTGLPGDVLVYQKSISKGMSAGESSGTVMGMLRLIDPEDNDAERTSYTTPVDKNLQPLSADRIPHVWTYQAIPLLVANPNGMPNATGMFAGGLTSIISGSTAQAQVLSYTDVESNPGSFAVDYDTSDGFFPDFESQTITTAGPFPVLLEESHPLNNNSSVASVSRVAEIRYTDGLHADRSIYIPYTLSGNQAPSGFADLPFDEYVIDSLMQLILENFSDPENNQLLISIDWEWDGTEGGFSPDPGYNLVTLQQALASRPANSTPGNWLLGIRITDPLHPNTEITAIPYRTVPPNTPPTAEFITPSMVESATTTTVTCSAFSDLDGDDVEVEIDWNGDGDFDDAGESELAFLSGAGAVYTSPVLNNNTSASPLAPRTVNIRYTDNVSPHEWITTSAGQYILGGNRPPTISGTLSLEEAQLAPPAIFKVLQNGASAVDPEGNAVTYTLRAVPNSGSATNSTFTAFPKTSATYMNPSVGSVAFTVYANDSLHATTSGTPWPALTGTVCSVYLATWNFDSSNDGWLTGFGGLPNSDAANWSAWTWCAVLPGQGLSGSHWTTGPDIPGPCTNHPDDYSTQVNNNLVSPVFSLATVSKANLVFNASYNGRGSTNCHYRIYISTDGGANWIQLYDYTKSSASKVNTTNQAISLNAYQGSSNVRLRFQLQDTTTTGTWGASPYAGWSIDAVRVTGCP